MAKKLTIAFGSRTEVGLTRSENQDSLGKFPQASEDLDQPPGQLFIVADGMGGHQGGREASQIAVQTIQEHYFAHPDEDADDNLEDAFQVANKEIYGAASNDAKLLGMGTTCTTMVLFKKNACIAHVGDSRAYQINQESIKQITKDHSQVAEMKRQGILSEKEAREHPHRSLLNRALGAREDVEVDIYDHVPLVPGDYFLLCTDGLATVQDDELKQIVLSNPPQEACDELIKLAYERGAEDNVSVLVVQIQ